MNKGLYYNNNGIEEKYLETHKSNANPLELPPPSTKKLVKNKQNRKAWQHMFITFRNYDNDIIPTEFNPSQ